MSEEYWEERVRGSSCGWPNKSGGLRKIADAEPPCLSHEHNPPSHMVLSPGTYEYTCPACGETTTFVVPMIVC